MPYVFSDEVGSNDIIITTSADWAVDTGVLPNGDNAVHGDGTIAATYWTAGTALDFRSGSWSVEFMLWTSGISGTFQTLVSYGPPGDANLCWMVYLSVSEEIVFGLYSFTNPVRVRTAGPVSTSTWHHVVCQKTSGVTDPNIYVDSVLSGGAVSGAAGVANAPNSVSRLYLGTQPDGSTDLGTAIRIAKLAIYDRLITSGEISDHYLAMTSV